MYTHSVSSKAHADTHWHKLPPSQLGSHPPIRQRKLADCDPTATLCLNCSPSACRNERLPVYSAYAFSLPPRLSLYFPSMDAGAGGEGGFNDAVVHLKGERHRSCEGVRENEYAFKK